MNTGTYDLKTPYYIYYADEFIDNYKRLEHAFQTVYPQYRIAYSFKTNYTPAVCELVKELGGYAEVVSDMEYTLAKKIGFNDEHIIYNGPGKGGLMEQCILNNVLVNIDNLAEIDRVCRLASQHQNRIINIGIRVNFDIENGLLSRFGLDVEGESFQEALDRLNECENVYIQGLHFHISRARNLEAWRKRIERIIEIADNYFDYGLSYIDIGSGMFGQMDAELQEQFENVPTYEEYANAVARIMLERFKDVPEHERPLLFTEPGTTVVSKYFHLFTKVLDVKNIRGKKFALLDCSFHNVGEICGLKKVPMHISKTSDSYTSCECVSAEEIDLVGYTCLEQDIICRNYKGELEKGDLIELYNVGGYSIVLKPPFIHPDIPIYMIRSDEMTCVKRTQTFDDIFAPYYWTNKEKS